MKKPVLTAAAVRKRVASIDIIKDDDEGAHGNEDALWEEVLEAIAEGASNPKALAREALATRAIDFARWCA